jgi:putative membrane protein
MSAQPPIGFDPKSIRRPAPELLTYYLIISLLSIVGFPFVFIPLYLKFRTLQYRFDEEGIAMCWGLLFRKEIYLTYRRIQDIHVNRNILHRWMGLGVIAVQTASGSAGAEMTIEGILDLEPLRDYLYAKMRGAKGQDMPVSVEQGTAAAVAQQDEALALLVEIRDALRKLSRSSGTD